MSATPAGDAARAHDSEYLRTLFGMAPAARQAPKGPAIPTAPIPGLSAFLAIEGWAERDIPEADLLLGDLVTTTSRAFIVGRTGLGKTMFALGMAVGMAAGTGFLHWKSYRPAKVLYIDGEMPGELIKSRAIDALRRAEMPPRPGYLTIFDRDGEDSFAKAYPALGRMEPLNTEAGRNFVLALIAALGGVDVVIFDNVMSLVSGDQKDEIPWSETQPLVQALTSKRIGQVWMDHTGHATDRQYGSSTKAWRFDSVGVMAALPGDQRAAGEMGFSLSFDAPGKARRSKPSNWHDFETVTIRLADDRWIVEPAGPAARKTGRLSPTCAKFYKALLDAFAVSPIPNQTTRAAWFCECVRHLLVDDVGPDDDRKTKDAKRSRVRKYLAEMLAAGLVRVDAEVIFNLKKTTD